MPHTRRTRFSPPQAHAGTHTLEHTSPTTKPFFYRNATGLTQPETSQPQLSAMSDPELEAVESALDALALADTESAFQKVVTRLLPAVLSALSTPSAAARAKCIQTLQHINVRVRALPSIHLPFTDVLTVASDPNAAALTTNVAIQGGYLQRCFDRLKPPERALALPKLLQSAVLLSPQNRDSLHYLALRALIAAAAGRPKSPTADLWNLISGCPEHAVFSFFDYALLALRGKLKAPVPESALLAFVQLASEYAGVKHPQRAATVFPHLLVASGTAARSALVAAAEDALKRIDACDVLAAADPTISDVLFELFNDTLADVPLRIVLLGRGLLKVSLCASCFPEVLDVFRHSLFTPGTPPRFQALGMQFVSFVIKNAEDGPIQANAGVIVDMMMKLVRNETGGSPSFPDKLRGFGYVAIANLVVRIPAFMGRNEVTPDLFFSAALDNTLPMEVRSCASQALVALKRILYFGIDDTTSLSKKVRSTLLGIIQTEDDNSASARTAAVQWANECFDFGDCDARLIDIIAAADPKPDIQQHALLGLSPKRILDKDKMHDGKEQQGTKMPDFSALVQIYVDNKDNVVRPKSIEAFLRFSMLVLKHLIVSGGRLEVLNSDKLEAFFATAPSSLTAMSTLLNEAHSVILSRRPTTEPGIERAALSIILLAALVKSLRVGIAARYRGKLTDLAALTAKRSAIGDSKLALAFSALTGIVSEGLSNEDLQKFVNELKEGLEPNSSGVASGRHEEDTRAAKILCLGWVISSARHRTDVAWDEAETSLFAKTCVNIMRRATMAVDSSSVVRTAACLALGQCGADGSLPMPLETRKRVIGTLTGILKVHDCEPKLAEAAAAALGRISAGEPRTTFKQMAVESLLGVCKDRKEEEIRFTAAESLVRCSAGFDVPPPATLLESEFDSRASAVELQSEELQLILQIKTNGIVVRPEVPDDGATDKQMDLTSIMRSTVKLAYDERPGTRAAGCVAMFTFLRMLGPKKGSEVVLDERLRFATSDDEARYSDLRNVVQKFLPEAQQAFSVLLGDRNDFVQQLASCGVALVYDLCPPDMQRDLVSNLVRSLTSGKARAASTVPGDQGTLLELGGVNVKESTAGNRSATYKELCTLAQDMGQPELVYKFMDLAGHTALWNSRKGAALAGRALLDNEIAAEQLRPHVKSLLPRLYVYCYDPTDSVKVAMASVLRAVVKASKHGSVAEAVTANFDSVIDYCLKTIYSRQWRSREAACGALRDAIGSRSWEQVKDKLSDFWYYTLRALDDIKESVRKAAEGTGRALSELSIHLCNPAQVSVEVATQAVRTVVPAVLPAFTHSVAEVRVLATKTLSKVIRYGGDALRSAVPDLVSNLLEAATELEPQVLNYAQFHVDEPEELQNARVNVAAASDSPIVDSLERLAGLVDESIVDHLVPKLTRLARLGVGIPTRAATARFFASILQSRAAVMEPYASKLMFAAAGAAAMERNPTLRTAWCSAAGKAAKLSSTEDVTEYIKHMEDLSGSEDPNERSLSSYLAVGLWRSSPETARRHATALLPVAYMGRYETDDDAKGAGTNWKEVWGEGCPSTEAGLRLYAKEITHICTNRLMTSSQYRVKRSAAAALGALAEASNETVDIRYLCQSAFALLQALPGHIWDGKIVAVQAIGTIASSYSDLEVWSQCGGSESVVRRLLQESNRGKKEYRLGAIEATGKVLNQCHDHVDLYLEVKDALGSYLSGGAQDDGESTSNISRVVWETGSDADAVDARNKARKAQRMLCAASIECLEAAYPGSTIPQRQAAHVEDLILVTESVIKSDWELRLAALKAIESASSRTAEEVLLSRARDDDTSMLRKIVSLSGHGVFDMKYASVRRCGFSVLLGLGKQIDDKEQISKHFDAELRKAIYSTRSNDSDPSVQADAKRACLLYNIVNA